MLTQATNSRAPTPLKSRELRASASASGPSKTRDSARSGSTGTVLIHTVKRSPSAGEALRVRTLETPQKAAAITTRANPRIGPEALSSTAATTMPDRATAMPSSRTRPGRSPRASIAKRAVKTAWACRTSEDSPAGIPARIPTNSSPNFPTPSASPTPMIHRHFTGGRPTKKTAGSAAARKRSPQKSSGGKWSRPTSMTTKLTPHRAATATARAMCGGRMRRASCAPTM
ncbi:hypothetical protein GCM10018779_43430 [Streptomyces griseocarneus]|nr:hypothetical protein GCM10018779_43430 [Streptomyces griseocarneus]